MPEDRVPPADYNGLRDLRPTLPRQAYLTEEHHRRDLEGIWYTHWLYVCHASALAEPLSFRTYEIGDQSVVIVRDDKGGLGAFHNTCRHRGSRLCLEDEGRLKARALVCPYHNWTYGLDGRLRRVTSRWTPPDFDKKDYGLFPVAVAEWRGLIFVNLEGAETNSIEDSLGRRPDLLAHWPLERVRLAHSYRKVLACNWKLFWENFNECLHCPNVHPELSARVPIYGRRLIARKDAHDWEATAGRDEPAYRGGLAAGDSTWSLDGQSQPVTFGELSEEDRARGQTYMVSLPSGFVVGHVDYMRIVRLRPLGPTRTELQAEWFFLPEAMERAGFDPAPQIDFATIVLEQDAWACEINQQGLSARPYAAGVLMPEEYYLQQFYDWYHLALEGGGPARGGS